MEDDTLLVKEACYNMCCNILLSFRFPFEIERKIHQPDLKTAINNPQERHDEFCVSWWVSTRHLLQTSTPWSTCRTTPFVSNLEGTLNAQLKLQKVAGTLLCWRSLQWTLLEAAVNDEGWPLWILRHWNVLLPKPGPYKSHPREFN